jgi:hypothetical protein
MSDFIPNQIDSTMPLITFNVCIQCPVFQLIDDPDAFYSVKFQHYLKTTNYLEEDDGIYLSY